MIKAADRRIEMEAADALLDIGVSLPLFSFRIPWCKRPVQLRLMMRRPTLGTQIRLARIYLGMGVTADEMSRYDRHEELAFVAMHGTAVSRMIALTVCRGAVSGILLSRPLAWLLRNLTDPRVLATAAVTAVRCIGTRDFMTIIRSVEAVNPLKPRLSRKSPKGG